MKAPVITIITSAVVGCASALAPSPFTAAMIRDATAAGTTYVFEQVDDRGRKTRQRIEFGDVDNDGCTITVQALTSDGAPVNNPLKSRTTWHALQSHASYAASATQITETEVTVPAGTFDAWLYTVDTNDEGHRSIVRAYFAKSLPGAPVRHEVERDGRQVSLSVLIAHRSATSTP